MATLFARHIVLSADARLAISAVHDGGTTVPCLDVRLERRSPNDRSETAWHGTSAGFRLPAHLVPQLADALRTVATRGAAMYAATPLPDSNRDRGARNVEP